MIQPKAIKDGNGNILITEDSFEYLLNCLDNQKFGPRTQEQSIIDDYNYECRKILHQRYIFETCGDGYFLTKRYLYQDKLTPWSYNDVSKVYELFKDTKIIREKPKELPKESHSVTYDEEPVTEGGWFVDVDEPWLIERPMRYDHDYLTISEDGSTNRTWKEDEIERISIEFEGYEVTENQYQKEKMWKDQLSKMDINVVENFIRKTKIKNL
jgi:hypothetical protein